MYEGVDSPLCDPAADLQYLWHSGNVKVIRTKYWFKHRTNLEILEEIQVTLLHFS